MLVSGGQGDDEPRSEASAMAEYLVEAGVPEGDVLREDRSTTTAENLRYSTEVLTRRDVELVRAPRWRLGAGGPVVVVTSNYHALRTATLMRTAGLPGHVVGAPTAGYFWPSATIREYLALLRDHRTLTVAGLAVSFLPLVVIGGMAVWSRLFG